MAALTEDVVKTSEIEGDILDRTRMRSSIARRLGIDVAGLPPADRPVDDVLPGLRRQARPARAKM